MLAQLLPGLDERAPDVAVLDQAVVLRQAAGAGEAAGGGVAGVGHRDHEVGLDRRLGREQLAHAPARGLHDAALEARVGTREVDVLEDAERLAVARDDLARLQPALGEGDHLAGQDLAQVLRADDVERARLRGDAVALPEQAERERAQAGGVAEGDHAVGGHDDGREAALEARHDVLDRVLDRLRLVRGEQRGDDLRVRGRAERDAPLPQLGVQLDGVDEVAVVAERDLAPVGAPDGLRVLPRVGARGRVADVRDGHVPLQRAQLLLVEDLVDEALVAHRHDVAALGRRDARGLLSAVLKGVESEVREASDVVPWGIDAEHAALVARPVAFIVDGGRHAVQRSPIEWPA